MTATVTIREHVGAPQVTPDWVDGALDQPGIPQFVEQVFLPEAGFPWADAHEDPAAAYDSTISYSADPSVFDPTAGNLPIAGAYEGAFNTRGPVVPFGYEVSGGLFGDQAIGRTMRFANNGPIRYDPDGVQFPSWNDELAAALYYNDVPFVSSNESTTALIQSL